MTMDTETKVVIAFLKSAIEQTPFHIEKENVDWEKVEKILSFHRVSNMAYYGYLRLENKDCVPPQLVQKLERAYQKAIVKEAHQHFALEEIRETFEKNGIDFVPLKGCVLKYLYPMPQMRVMGDLDVLYKEEQRETVARCFNEMGYTPAKGDELQDVFHRDPYLRIEMHRGLLAEPKAQKEYFDKIWERLNSVEDSNFEYEMTLEDYYLFLLAHMAKHFFISGTGLRSLTDFHVFYHMKRRDLNDLVLNSRLHETNLAEFEKYLIEMDECLFGGKEWPDDAILLAFEYMLESGLYGTSKNRNANSISREKGMDKSPILGKIQYLADLVFLDRKNMERYYPWLKGRSYLLIPAWIFRLFQKLLFQRNKISKRLSYVRMEDQELYRMQQIQKRAGL